MLTTVIECDLKAPLSIGTTPSIRGERTPFLRLLH